MVTRLRLLFMILLFSTAVLAQAGEEVGAAEKIQPFSVPFTIHRKNVLLEALLERISVLELEIDEIRAIYPDPEVLEEKQQELQQLMHKLKEVNSLSTVDETTL